MLLFLGPEHANDTNEIDDRLSESDVFTGTFYLDSSDNFDSYLTELGVGYFLRQLALLALPIVTVQRWMDMLGWIVMLTLSSVAGPVLITLLVAGLSKQMLLSGHIPSPSN